VKEEAQETEGQDLAREELPAPQGIGVAVAIDWGLAVQTFLTPIIAIVHPSSQPSLFGLDSTLSLVLLFVIAWFFAGVCVLFGEMLRRGHNWTRWLQIAFNALLSLAGLAALPSLYQSITTGHFWSLVSEIILVIFSPLVVWRLSRSATGRWFKAISVAEARQRHGGKWVWFIALWAIRGGVLQTLAVMNR
jgi:ACR3 family arsenite efflux pump ArsB